MKLYYAPEACSLSPLIVAREAGIELELERVDIVTTPHVTERGLPFASINPKGYVPALRLDDGDVLTEGPAIVQLLADLAPASGLAPPAGTRQRYRLQEWLTFVGTELHRMFSPWFFHPEHGAKARDAAREAILRRFSFLDEHLAAHPFLLDSGFSAADAYAFTVALWSPFARIDLPQYPALAAWVGRIGERAAVRQALREHGNVAAVPRAPAEVPAP